MTALHWLKRAGLGTVKKHSRPDWERPVRPFPVRPLTGKGQWEAFSSHSIPLADEVG